MASSSSSSSPLSLPISPQQKHDIQEKYDVFLSFRGEDTRSKFVSHLYAALSAKRILTFMDAHELHVGDEISTTLSQAIQNSEIGVIIFSKNYASSTWCLNELVEILECKKRNKMSVVIPFFYEIDPSDVRKQKRTYEAAFAELEERFKDRMEKVHQWKAALTEASNLAGLNSEESRVESAFVKKIVENILERLRKCQSSDEQYFKGLIGIEEEIKEIESLLSIGSEDIRVIGIWGMGGSGKTTLAEVVYKKLSNSQSFNGCCFLKDVREKHKGPGGLEHLRKIIISCLLNDETIKNMVDPVDALSSNIIQRLQRVKVLIVLDDLDSSIHIDDLVKGYRELAPGSRIIVTARDKHVLTQATNRIHKVKSLDGIDSLVLFRLHAFPNNSPTTDDGMVSEIIRYAHGNPLALKVLGRFLCGRDKTVWEGALKKLKTGQRDKDLTIQQVLQISYDRLDNVRKHMFLDIAFLFNSSFTRDDAKSILGDAVEMEITLLIEKCLIEDDDGNELRMHDLLRQMGRDIVRDEDETEPGNRSRLCDAVEICDVLENCTGTAAVEVISLDMFEIKKNVIVHPGAFSNMRNLRVLRVYHGHDYTARNQWIHKFKLSIPQALHPYLSTKLRFLQWDSYPSKSLPSEFIPENLVRLLLRGSRVEKLWNGRKDVSLPVLRMMDLSFSKFLTQVPYLTRAPMLEEINLKGCTSLVQFSSSLQNLDELTCVNLDGCSKLRYVEEMFKRPEELSKSLIQKFISNVWPYPSQTHISQKFAPNLRCLSLRETAIETVPPSIRYLSGLVKLDLESCKRLKSLPESICHLKSLESLNLEKCEKLKTLPEILEPMVRLENLYLSESGIKELPESIENLVSLEYLSMSKCKDLEFLPNNLGKLRNLDLMNLSYCSKIQELPPIAPSLELLVLFQCRRLKSLPKPPSAFLHVNAVGCSSLENISLPEDLYSFQFYGCGKLDQKQRNILADEAELGILSLLKSVLEFSHVDIGLRDFSYPGDGIPEWFDHQTCGTSISNIRPNWSDGKLLSLAFCIVLHQNTIYPNASAHLKLKFNSQTFPTYPLFLNYTAREEMSKDNVIITQVTKRALEANHVDITRCADVSFHASLGSSPNESFEIKKFGVRFIYEQDLNRLNKKTERKNKRHFNECCESSGSEAVDSLEEEDDQEAHFKKLKAMAT